MKLNRTLSPRLFLVALLVLASLGSGSRLALATADDAPQDAAHAVAPDGVPKNLGLGLESLVRDRQNTLARHEALKAAGKPRTEAEVADDLTAVNASYSHAQFDAKGRVLVNVYLDGTKTLEQVTRKLKKHALKIIGGYAPYRSGVVSAYMPLDEAARTAAAKGVRAVQLAPRPYLNVGLVTEQGTTVLHATETGYTGVGSTIGALSDTFNLLYTGQNPSLEFDTAQVDAVNDDLPGVGNKNNRTTPVDVLLDVADGVPTDEGRGMLQIVHDMAPDAHLAFATAEGTEVVFANNIEALAAPNNLMVPVMNPTGGITMHAGGGCNIICDDVGYLDEPMFSDGIVGQAIDLVATTEGVSYFSSAGNDANSGYSGTFSYVAPATGLTQGAAEGVNLSYNPGGQVGLSTTGVDPTLYAGGFHAFGTDGNGQPIVVQNVTTGSLAVTLVFQWDDPYDQTTSAMLGLPQKKNLGITTDYNILVFDAGTAASPGAYEPSLSGTANNFSTNQPIEIPGTTLSANTSYKIMLCRTTQTQTVAAGQPPAQQLATHLRYAAPSDGGGFSGDFIGLDNVETYGHNCASNCSGVAAYVYDAIPNITKDPNHVPTPLVEPFSSNGPVTIYFDAAGNRLSTPNLRRQPAFATVDGVDTSFFPATTGYVVTPQGVAVPFPVLPVTPPVEPIIGGPNPQDYDSNSFPNFFGTSAAAPHAAACAALIIEAASAKSLPTPNSRYIRSLLQATTQGQIDTIPSYCLATGTDATNAYTVSLSGTGDVSTDPGTFRITYAGPAGSTYQLTSMLIDLTPSELEFDTNATSGFPFTQGDTNSAETGGMNGATLNATAANGPANEDLSTATLAFTNFAVGDALTFGVDRDVIGINAYGNGVDQLQGSTFTATLTDTTNPNNTITVSGTFENGYNQEYNYKAGYGLVDVNAAIKRMLGVQ